MNFHVTNFKIVNLHYLSIITASILLTGCGNSEIDLVKKTIHPNDPTYTYGTALDNRVPCNKINWKTFKDDDGRKIVEYRCELKNVVPLMEAKHAYVKKDTHNEYKMRYDGLGNYIDSRIDDIERKEKSLEETKSKLEEINSILEKKYSNPDNPADYHEDPARAFAYWKIEKDRYIKAKEDTEYSIQNLEHSISSIKKSISETEADRERIKQKEEAALNKIDSYYFGIIKATEVIQWIVNEDRVFPGWTGIEIERKDGRETTQDEDWKTTMRGLILRRDMNYVNYVLRVDKRMLSK